MNDVPGMSAPFNNDFSGNPSEIKNAAEKAVICRGLTKRFSTAAALNNVDLDLPSGKIIGLLGPNGSGKTTFMKILAGVLTPSSGNVLVGGEEIGVSTKAKVSFLPDRGIFNPSMRVRNCMKLYRDFFADYDEEKAKKMFDDLHIDINSKLRTLSKGNLEKVHLIMTMSRNAKLYLLDEPIGGVDPATRDYILNTIIAGYNPEATLIISTHLIRDIENILEGFVFIGGGTIVMSGDADEAREKYGKTLDELFREVFRCC